MRFCYLMIVLLSKDVSSMSEKQLFFQLFNTNERLGYELSVHRDKLLAQRCGLTLDLRAGFNMEDERKLFVGAMPQEAKESDVREYFGKYGEIESVILKIDQMTGR